MNLKKLSVKLQTALANKGRYIKINQSQSYSPKAGRMVTKYVLSEKRLTEKGKPKDFAILNTYQMADVVKELARMLNDT